MSKNTAPKNILKYLVQELKSKFAEKSEIPSVNNNTITAQLNGTTVDSFTLNQATDKTINIEVTKSDVGLGSVGNFYAVSTVENQGLLNLQKKNARDNINAANDEAPNENYIISDHQIQINTSSIPTTVNSFITKLRTLVINVMDDIRTWLNAEIDFNYPALGTDHKFNMGVVTQSSISDFSDAVEDALDEVARGFNDHADWVATKADKTEISGSKSINGNPIVISDAANAYAEEVIANIEPIQDLHGYDHPWIGGAGKNLLEIQSNSGVYNGITFTVNRDNNGNVVSITANGTATATTYYKIMDGFVAKAEVSYTISGSPSGINGVLIYNDNQGKAWNDYDAPTVSFESDTTMPIYIRVGNGITLSNAVFQPMIEQGTVKTAFEPYTNISPITGITQLDFAGCGKNLYDKSNGVLQGYPMASYTWRQNSSDANELSIMVELKEGEAYTVKRLIGANCVFRIQASATSTLTNGQSLQNIDSSGGNDITEKTFTVPTGYPYVIFYVRNTDRVSSLTIEQIINAFQVESGSTVTAYEPYTPNNHTISLGRTVYGGKLNVQTGELVVDMAFVEYDGSSDESWNMEDSPSGGKNFYISMPTESKKGQYKGQLLSNRFPARETSSSSATGTLFISGSGNLNVTAGSVLSITTVADFKTWLTSNLLQVCYELATPITYHLIPEQVKLLKGYNYITTNADTLDLTYQVNNVLGEILGEAEGYADRISKSEIFEITPGDDTTSRTFTFSKKPKKVTISWYEGTTSSSWASTWSFLWGDRRAYGIGGNTDNSSSGQYTKVSAITYGADGKSFTITGANAGNAANTSGADHSGRLFVEY